MWFWRSVCWLPELCLRSIRPRASPTREIIEGLADLNAKYTELKAELRRVEGELKAEFRTVRAEFKTMRVEIGSVRNEMRQMDKCLEPVMHFTKDRRWF